MTSLFTPDPPPAEDPAVAAQRDAEQKRANDERVRATQDQLTQETQTRNRSYGTRSLLGSLLGKSSLLGSG